MVQKPRRKLTTPEAERMGVEAAREWEQLRKAEQAEYDKEQEKLRRKEDYIAPLVEAGVSKQDAEEAYKQHVLESAKAHNQSARHAWQRVRMRAV